MRKKRFLVAWGENEKRMGEMNSVESRENAIRLGHLNDQLWAMLSDMIPEIDEAIATPMESWTKRQQRVVLAGLHTLTGTLKHRRAIRTHNELFGDKDAIDMP